MSLGSCDLLLPPAPASPTLISSAQETSEEFDDERRERWREERQCNCCEKDPNCRHFLTYDLFEVCLALREVYAKRKCLLPQERKSLCFTASYHDWFIPPFAAWLAIVSEQVPLQSLCIVFVLKVDGAARRCCAARSAQPCHAITHQNKSTTEICHHYASTL